MSLLHHIENFIRLHLKFCNELGQKYQKRAWRADKILNQILNIHNQNYLVESSSEKK